MSSWTKVCQIYMICGGSCESIPSVMCKLANSCCWHWVNKQLIQVVGCQCQTLVGLFFGQCHCQVHRKIRKMWCWPWLTHSTVKREWKHICRCPWIRWWWWCVLPNCWEEDNWATCQFKCTFFYVSPRLFETLKYTRCYQSAETA